MLACRPLAIPAHLRAVRRLCSDSTREGPGTGSYFALLLSALKEKPCRYPQARRPQARSHTMGLRSTENPPSWLLSPNKLLAVSYEQGSTNLG